MRCGPSPAHLPSFDLDRTLLFGADDFTSRIQPGVLGLVVSVIPHSVTPPKSHTVVRRFAQPRRQSPASLHPISLPDQQPPRNRAAARHIVVLSRLRDNYVIQTNHLLPSLPRRSRRHQPRQLPTFHRSSHRSGQAALVAQRPAPRLNGRLRRSPFRRPRRL